MEFPGPTRIHIFHSCLWKSSPPEKKYKIIEPTHTPNQTTKSHNLRIHHRGYTHPIITAMENCPHEGTLHLRTAIGTSAVRMRCQMSFPGSVPGGEWLDPYVVEQNQDHPWRNHSDNDPSISIIIVTGHGVYMYKPSSLWRVLYVLIDFIIGFGKIAAFFPICSTSFCWGTPTPESQAAPALSWRSWELQERWRLLQSPHTHMYIDTYAHKSSQIKRNP